LQRPLHFLVFGLVDAKQCFCTAGKDHENEKMRPMPWEVGLRRALPQYLERPLVGSPEFLFYSM
jgi:hypothetical protein